MPIVVPPRLVALCGPAGCGKSTCAEYLLREWGYRVLKFASPLKEMLRGLGLNDEHLEGGLKERPCDLLAGRSPRHAMQTLGTEWGRMLMGTDFWADMWSQAASQVLKEGGKVVVDDCRFPNEMEAIRKLNGLSIGILREGLEPVAEHISEKHRIPTDTTILNNKGKRHLVAELCRTLGLDQG